MANLRHWQSSRFEIVPRVEPIYVCWDVWTFNHLPVQKTQGYKPSRLSVWYNKNYQTVTATGQVKILIEK